MKNIPIITYLIVLYTSISTYLSITINPFLSLLSILIAVLIFADIILHNEGFSSVSTIFYLISGRLKRVKTEFGRFYIIKKLSGNKKNIIIELYEDNFFYIKNIGSHYYSDNDSMKKWIKSIYDTKYNERELILSKERELKKWNGFIDIKDERDSKIKDVIN